MVTKTAYPPSKTHSSHFLAPSAAQDLLAAYLSKTSTKPFLHPDAQLSTTGITYAAASGPTGGLAIHHLKRIEAGLRGEVLVAESEEELKALFADELTAKEGDDTRLEAQIAGGGKRKRTEEWADANAAGAGKGDWQDADEYAAEQEEVTGDVGDRGTEGVRQVAGPPAIEGVEAGGQVDKAARKAAKKAKKAAEKKEKLAEKKKS